MNPTALFLSYLTVIKLVDLGFSSVMIFGRTVLIYLDHRIVLVLYTILTSQEVYIRLQLMDMKPTRVCLACDILTVVCCVGCLPQCAISLITPNSSEMIMPCHIAIFRHKFYLIIKPYTHLVHLVIELCINFVYSIKN